MSLGEEKTESSLQALEHELGANWGYIWNAQRYTKELLTNLEERVAGLSSPDCSIVIFGSLARGEASEASDLDWNLLIDGLGDPKHQDLVHEIKEKIPGGLRVPGIEGTFGHMISSHELIHRIGGEEDTNKNTTRRVLLLLEAKAIGLGTAYERVLRCLLERYLGEDRGLWHGSGRPKVPRFLLNDVVRYWRTMAVDFAYKQRTRAGQGWALRNLKLRMSRKLIFVSGLLLCFSPAMELDAAAREELFGDRKNLPRLIDRLLPWILRPPLENLALTLRLVAAEPDPTRRLLDSYDGFLGLLADASKREELGRITFDEFDDSSAFEEARRLSREFQAALDALFLHGQTSLTGLTLRYGVF